ncbi:Aspyridones efflux protein-like protein 1 [Elsinoe fawcettii]|nr:Aspyridones efflux protein-like protein 1 [Elsinoe fawcettii]
MTPSTPRLSPPLGKVMKARANEDEKYKIPWEQKAHDHIPPHPKRWLQVLAGALIFMNNWGLPSSFGVYFAYYQLPTSLPSLSSQGNSPSQISWIGTTQASLTLLVGIVSGPLFDKGHFYKVVIPASLFLGLSFVFLSFCTKYWSILLIQGILQGVCSGMLYIPSISVVRNHFANDKRGTALGLVTAGAPIGGMLYPIIFRFLLQRHGFAWSTRIVGFISLGTLALACLLMKFTGQKNQSATRPINVISLKAMMRSPPYLSFLAAGFLLFCAMLVPYVLCATYSVNVVDGIPTSVFYGEQEAAANVDIPPSRIADVGKVRDRAFYTVVIVNGANLFGRIIPAALTDLGWPAEILLGTSTVLMGSLGLAWIPAKSRGSYTAFLVLYGFCSGTLSTLPPIALPPLCPEPSLYSTSLGIVYLCAGFGVLFGTPVAALLNNHSPASFPYLAVQVWTGGFMLLGTLFVAYSGYHIGKLRKSVVESGIELGSTQSPPLSVKSVIRPPSPTQMISRSARIS